MRIIKPIKRVALIRTIRLEAKKAMTNEKGSSSWYDAIKIWIPKRRKKQLAKIKMNCLIHQKILCMGIILHLLKCLYSVFAIRL